jgi:hypothetical protein
MIWIVDSFTTHLFLRESACDLEVPIRVKIEFRLKGRTVHASSITKKVYYNRPLLIAEGCRNTPEELDSLIERTVTKAIKNHLGRYGLVLDESPPARQ